MEPWSAPGRGQGSAWRILPFAALLMATLELAVAKTPVFHPPSKAERLDAIGSLKGLPDIDRRAYTPGNDFQPIDTPGPGDWLVAHPEQGQTVDQFLASWRLHPDKVRKFIYLQPLGAFPADTAPSTDTLRDFCERFFAMKVKVLPPLDLTGAALTTRINRYTQKRQVLVPDVLKVMKRHVPLDAFCVLGITMEDLYPDPSWNYVFGQASPPERVGIYSFARYDPAFFGLPRGRNWKRLLLERSVKVLAHETGHMFGMDHCIFFNCLMNGANNMVEADSRPIILCPVCLRKLHSSVEFDIVKRYRRLEAFYAEHGIRREAEWIHRRLVTLESDSSSSARTASTRP